MQIHMWDYFNNVKQAALVYSNQTLEEANLQMDQSVSIIWQKSQLPFLLNGLELGLYY